jgi:hypothetical protein
MSATNPNLQDNTTYGVTMNVVSEEGEGIAENNVNISASDYKDKAATIVPSTTMNIKFRPPLHGNPAKEDDGTNYRQSNNNKNVQISGFVKSQKQLTLEQNMPNMIGSSGIRLLE